MMKYIFAILIALSMGISAKAQPHHSPIRRPVPPRVVHTHHTFSYQHRPNIVLYGSFVQYRQFGYAVVGYNNLTAVQNLCFQYGFQVVQINPVQSFVVVRLPVSYSWNTISTFSRLSGVRFIDRSKKSEEILV